MKRPQENWCRRVNDFLDYNDKRRAKFGIAAHDLIHASEQLAGKECERSAPVCKTRVLQSAGKAERITSAFQKCKIRTASSAFYIVCLSWTREWTNKTVQANKDILPKELVSILKSNGKVLFRIIDTLMPAALKIVLLKIPPKECCVSESGIENCRINHWLTSRWKADNIEIPMLTFKCHDNWWGRKEDVPKETRLIKLNNHKLERF